MKQLLLLAATALLLSQETIPQSSQQQPPFKRVATVATQPAPGRTGTAAVVAVADGSPMPETGIQAMLHYIKSCYQLLKAHPAIIPIFVVAPNQKDIIPVLAPAGQKG